MSAISYTMTQLRMPQNFTRVDSVRNLQAGKGMIVHIVNTIYNNYFTVCPALYIRHIGK